MKDYSDREIYVLRHLQKCGLGGQPLSNLVASSPIPVKELYDVLKTLQDDKLIKLRGDVELDELKALIDEVGPVEAPVMDERGQSWKGNNVKLFDDRRETSGRFFKTDVRLTLRGRANLVFMKDQPDPRAVAGPQPKKQGGQKPAP